MAGGVIHAEHIRRAARVAYQDGESLGAVAAQLGISADTARRWCKDIRRPRFPPRLPPEPLLLFLHDRQTIPSAASDRTGINVERAITNGGFSYHEADVVAVRYGVHPANIWGDLWWQT
jgi:hypothetical protein